MSHKRLMHICGNYSWAVVNHLFKIDDTSRSEICIFDTFMARATQSISAPLDKIQVSVCFYICMFLRAHFQHFFFSLDAIQLQQSLWHFRMCLLKACPATRCSYKCTVNPHWIHVSGESFREMKLHLGSKIIMWYSVPQTVHFPDGKSVRIVLGGEKGKQR